MKKTNHFINVNPVRDAFLSKNCVDLHVLVKERNFSQSGPRSTEVFKGIEIGHRFLN